MTEYVTKFSAAFANPNDPIDYDDNLPGAVFDTFDAAVEWLVIVAEQCVADIGQDEEEQWPEAHRQSLIDLIAALHAAPGPDLTLHGGGMDWWVSPVQSDPAWNVAVSEYLSALRASRPEPSEPEPF